MDFMKNVIYVSMYRFIFIENFILKSEGASLFSIRP